MFIGLKDLLEFAPAIDILRFWTQRKSEATYLGCLQVFPRYACSSGLFKVLTSSHRVWRSREHCHGPYRTAAWVSGFRAVAKSFMKGRPRPRFSGNERNLMTERHLFWSVWISRGHTTSLVLRANTTILKFTGLERLLKLEESFLSGFLEQSK